MNKPYNKQKQERIFIDDARINKLHRVFNDLRARKKIVLPETGERVDVTFDFRHMGSEFYQFRVRFAQTERMLKFIVEANDQDSGVTCHQMEKTDNIVRDIADIYINRSTTMYDDFMRMPEELLVTAMEKLYDWATSFFDASFVRSERPQVDLVPKSESEFNSEKLYYGLITESVATPMSPNKSAVELKLMHGVTVRLLVPSDITKMYTPGKVYLVNSNFAHRVLQLTNAMGHVMFERSQLDAMKKWIAERKEQDHGQSKKAA